MAGVRIRKFEHCLECLGVALVHSTFYRVVSAGGEIHSPFSCSLRRRNIHSSALCSMAPGLNLRTRSSNSNFDSKASCSGCSRHGEPRDGGWETFSLFCSARFDGLKGWLNRVSNCRLSFLLGVGLRVRPLGIRAGWETLNTSHESVPDSDSVCS